MSDPTGRDPAGACSAYDARRCAAAAPAPSFGSSNSAEHYNNGYTGDITVSFGSSNSAEHYSHGYTGKLPPSKPKPAAKPKPKSKGILGHLHSAVTRVVNVAKQLNPVTLANGCTGNGEGINRNYGDCFKLLGEAGLVVCTVATDGACAAAADGTVDEEAAASNLPKLEVRPNFTDPAESPGTGWEWRGAGDPGTAKGSWYNPNSGESLHPDLGHPDPIGPHYDWKAPNGTTYRVYPDGTVVPK